MQKEHARIHVFYKYTALTRKSKLFYGILDKHCVLKTYFKKPFKYGKPETKACILHTRFIRVAICQLVLLGFSS